MNNENKPSVIAELQKVREALEAKEGEQNHGNNKESNS